MDRLAFEIVAEAEIAQHLEERVVVGRAAHVVDIAGPQAFWQVVARVNSSLHR